MNAIITGASKGIGRAIAISLAEKGYNLAVCARNREALEGLSATLSRYDVRVIASVADCSRKEELMAFAREVSEQLGRVDILVNNVGLFMPAPLLDEPDFNFEFQQQLNVNAAYYFSKYFGKAMRQSGSGHIFNICSIASLQVIENAGSYSVTKAAMLSLNHVLRKELAVHGVKVTAILPGSTHTASWEGTEIDKELFVQPDDIAQCIGMVLGLSKGVNVDEIVLTPLNFKS